MFCTGRPKIFGDATFGQESFVCIKCDASGELLAAITLSHISIWSGGRHHIMLAHLTRHPDEVATDGDNDSVYWKPDSSAIAVKTTRGFIRFYNVHELQERVYPPTTELTDITTVLTSPVCATLSFRSQAELLKDHVRCVCNDGGLLTVGTNDGFLVRLQWSGELADSVSVGQLIDNIRDPQLPIAQVSHSHALQAYGVVFATGEFALLGYPEERIDLSLRSLQGEAMRLDNDKAVQTAFGDRRHYLAVGTENGHVILYSIATFSRVRSFAPPTSVHCGPVQCFAWASDCSSLAVGWRQCGVAVYSPHGRDSERTEMLEPFPNGITSLAWGQQSLELLVSAPTTPTMLQFDFLKAARELGCSQDDNSNTVLLGADRIWMAAAGGWEQLVVPPLYLASNWPLAHVSLSDGGRFIAVSGRRGAAIYDAMAQRWKVFGDVTQEREVEAVGLQWFGRTLVIACRNPGTEEYKILFYPYTHLDRASLLFTIPLVSRPLLIDVNGSALAVYLASGVLMVFRLNLRTTDAAQTTLHVQRVHQIKISLPSILSDPPLPPKHPLLLRLLISSRGDADILRALILSADRKLWLIEIPSGKYREVADAVHSCWQTPGALKPFMADTFWSYGDRGLLVWQLNSDGVPAVTSEDTMLKLDDDVVVLGLSASLLSMVGVCPGKSSRAIGAMTHFDVRLKTHPFLPYVLTHLLVNGRDDQAVAAAHAVDRQRNFAHSLEMLLHATLEDDWFATASDEVMSQPETPSLLNIPRERQRQVSAPRWRMLKRVTELLRVFPEYVEVVISCTRKTDFELWDILFAVAGDPQHLMEHALSSGLLRAAASCVIPLQHTGGPPQAAGAVFRLLEASLQGDDLELAGELVRYIRPWLDAATNVGMPEDLAFFVERALESYARHSLVECRIARLIRFARSTDFPLRPWLRKEKDRAAEILDMHAALQNVTGQYGLRLATASKVLGDLKAALSDPEVVFNAMPPPMTPRIRSESITQLTQLTPPQTPVSVELISPDSMSELSLLLQDMLAAECVQWALVLSLLTRQFGTMLLLLKAYPDTHLRFSIMAASGDAVAAAEIRELIANIPELPASLPVPEATPPLVKHRPAEIVQPPSIAARLGVRAAAVAEPDAEPAPTSTADSPASDLQPSAAPVVEETVNLVMPSTPFASAPTPLLSSMPTSPDMEQSPVRQVPVQVADAVLSAHAQQQQLFTAQQQVLAVNAAASAAGAAVVSTTTLSLPTRTMVQSAPPVASGVYASTAFVHKPVPGVISAASSPQQTSFADGLPESVRALLAAQDARAAQQQQQQPQQQQQQQSLQPTPSAPVVAAQPVAHDSVVASVLFPASSAPAAVTAPSEAVPYVAPVETVEIGQSVVSADPIPASVSGDIQSQQQQPQQSEQQSHPQSQPSQSQQQPSQLQQAPSTAIPNPPLPAPAQKSGWFSGWW
eukprot:TRINITY_DN1579_c2_g1_i1.p1 TRINITY_DN1579_c2_g1~~TRINITY_DN1579_c2_g1_i1.p1  ORF type:complete len:1439 (+),score=343.45 TRINITY_DN1579_c2_g1_i1:4261-8577(+)